MTFQKAVKRKAKLRIGLVGPSGSGKTFTALRIARGLGGRVAVIDTEHGSASLYADLFDFDVMELASFAPDTYVAAIQAAADAGYDVVVVDSLSHAWMGKDGALEQVDKHAARERGNSFGAWRHVTPMHNRLVETIVGAPIHVIATMRSKTEYVIEEDSRGKKVPRKIGMAPVQRDGMEYEFTVVGDMDYDHRLMITKSRCSALADAVIEKPGEDVAATLTGWLENAAPEAPRPTPFDPPTLPDEQPGNEPATVDQLTLLSELVRNTLIKEKEREHVLQRIADGITKLDAIDMIEDAKRTIQRREEKVAKPDGGELPLNDERPTRAPRSAVEAGR